MSRPATRRRNERRTAHDHRAGLTLTEVAIGMSISSIASYMILHMIVLAFGTYHTGENLIGNQEKLDAASRALSREIRQADLATLVASGSSVLFTIPADVDGDGTVLDASGNLEFGPAIEFRLSEDLVPGERRVVTVGLDSVEFVEETGGVRVTLTLSASADGTAGIETVEGWIPARNTTAQI